ncbi:RIP metalloprotease RseP [Labrys wisconsinensis]|uniref:Zinc metalloprotease n=1 Tax=Labrys wisconsinensis TaxID=425677 RepID=A0ABU0J4X2_9HYPH|nr:RIP metalloprotease RseP [Labrys wisconsinensis]MDQ0469308.1 regulator of sigma E protease [Labrys wisconsinensis]
MNFVASLGTLGGSTLGYVVPFLFVLSIIVFFHELGHFIVGRWCGVRVLTFSLGFGPELFGFNDRHGTRWRVAAVPLGGYVKFFGDANAASMPDVQKNELMTPEERAVSFFHKPIWKRAAIVAAGPIANFILAILIFAAFFSVYGKLSVTSQVGVVIAGSAADKAGIRAGDIIVAIDGKPIAAFADIPHVVEPLADKTVPIEIDRNGARATLSVTPTLREQPPEATNPVRQGQLGIQPAREQQNPFQALWLGTQEVGNIISQTFSFLGSLVAGHGDTRDMGGVVKIAQISKHVAESSGLIGLISLAAFLSVSIGLLNLFPIPLLDGGHLVFYAIEAIQGRPLRETTQELLYRVGLAFVVMLMVFSLVNDVIHPFAG